jgi:hypothetical protein
MPFLNHYTPPKYYIDFTKNQAVSVIVNFAADGRFMPVYIRYISSDQSEITYKIDSVKWFRDYSNRIVFCCFITNYGKQVEVLLSFHLMECTWTMSI